MGADYSVEARLYSEDNEQFVQTDLEKMRGAVEEKTSELQGDKLAVVLKFQLGSSQYATMALRELTKGKIQEYKPDFGGGR
jgi:tRNA pseudouridine13 synthase